MGREDLDTIHEESRGVRVALVRLPLQFRRTHSRTYMCPPLGLAYVAASLRVAGFRIHVVDGLGEAPSTARVAPGRRGVLRVGLDLGEIAARVPADARLIGVSCMFTEEWPVAREVIAALRSARPDAFVVAGGEHISAVPEESLSDCPSLDACVVGEGEETAVELSRAVAAGRSLDGIAGIVYRSTDGVRRNAARTRLRDLDKLPQPAWDSFPMARYIDARRGYGVNRSRSLPILATRGCPYQCTFCSSPNMWTTRWAAREPLKVIDEMEEAVEAFRIQNFDFYDLTAVLRKDWIVEFCRRLIERRLNVNWQIPSGTRSEALSGEVPALLQRSGCRNLVFAPESGSPSMLERIKKRIDLGRMKSAIREALAAGLKVKCNIVMGFPDETRRELQETIDFCRDLAHLGVHDVFVHAFTPYPGSELFRMLSAGGRIGPLDDAYLDVIQGCNDVRRSTSFCDALSDSELQRYRLRCMAIFYATSFLRFPRRAMEAVVHVARRRPDTRLEQSLMDLTDPVRWLRTAIPDFSRRQSAGRTSTRLPTTWLKPAGL